MTNTVLLEFDYQQKHYRGEAVATFAKSEKLYPAFDIFIHDEYHGTIIKTSAGWKSDSRIDGSLINTIGLLL